MWVSKWHQVWNMTFLLLHIIYSLPLVILAFSYCPNASWVSWIFPSCRNSSTILFCLYLLLFVYHIYFSHLNIIVELGFVTEVARGGAACTSLCIGSHIHVHIIQTIILHFCYGSDIVGVSPKSSCIEI